jgi:MFS family permease
VIGALAGLVAADAASLPLLYVVGFLLGIGETLFDTSAQSLMPAVVPRSELTRANGRLYAIELTLNQFVGPPLGGLLAGVAIAAAFVSSAACYAVAAVALVLMVGSFRPERAGPPTRLRTDIVEGVRYLWDHRLLRTLGFMTGVMNLGGTAVFAVLPVFAVDPGPMGLSEAGFGVLAPPFAVGSLAGSFAADRLERLVGRSGVLVLTVVVGGVAGIVPAVTPAVVPVGVSFAAIGLTGVAWNVVTVSLRQRIVPDRLLGRVNAGYRLLAWGSMPLGAAIGGILGETLGIRSVFVFAGVTCGALVLCRTIVTEEAIAAAERAAECEPEVDVARH